MIFDKKGFTLIELLVVISIIGILAAALVVSMPKVSQRARDMKCKANLKNLAQAALTYSVQNEAFPYANPGEWHNVGKLGGRSSVIYYDQKAWVNWTGSGYWMTAIGGKKERGTFNSQVGLMTMPQLSGDLAYDALTNGVLWSYVGKDASTYCCPAFKKAAKRQGITDLWRSYVMNYHFHHHSGFGGFHWHLDFTKTMDLVPGRGNKIARNAETVLMFAELPMDDIDTSLEGGDGKLDPDNDNEYIGFNHKVGKRNVSHVAYADGHVGALLEPSGGSQSDLVDLTSQLCNGEEIDISLLRDMH